MKGFLHVIGQIVGSFGGGIIAASIGRIKAIFLSGIPTIGCFMIIGTANNLWHIYFAMFFGGLSSSVAHTVVGETARQINDERKLYEYDQIQVFTYLRHVIRP